MPKSSVYPGLERKQGGPDNWVEAAGGLPKLIERVAKHLHYEKGREIGVAIATAVNWAKKMCSSGTAFGGKTKVSPRAQAAACKAASEWEAKKARGKGKSLREALCEQGMREDVAIQLLETLGEGEPSPAEARELAEAAASRLVIAEGVSKDADPSNPVTAQLLSHLFAEIPEDLDGALAEAIECDRLLVEAAREPSELGEADSSSDGDDEKHHKIKCPKCDTVQDASGKCVKCGHDLSQARKAKFAKLDEATATAEPEAKPEGTIDDLVLEPGAGLGDERVAQLQTRLGELGHKLNPDGQFGDKTAGAVKAFQRSVGIDETGAVDQATIGALRAYRAEGQPDGGAKPGGGSDAKPGEEGPPPVRRGPGAEGEDVTEVQTTLQARGYDVGADADGQYGDKTKRAVRAFQRDHGLRPDGVVGPHTKRLVDLLGSDVKKAVEGTWTITGVTNGTVGAVTVTDPAEDEGERLTEALRAAVDAREAAATGREFARARARETELRGLLEAFRGRRPEFNPLKHARNRRGQFRDMPDIPSPQTYGRLGRMAPSSGRSRKVSPPKDAGGVASRPDPDPLGLGSNPHDGPHAPRPKRPGRIEAKAARKKAHTFTVKELGRSVPVMSKSVATKGPDSVPGHRPIGQKDVNADDVSLLHKQIEKLERDFKKRGARMSPKERASKAGKLRALRGQAKSVALAEPHARVGNATTTGEPKSKAITDGPVIGNIQRVSKVYHDVQKRGPNRKRPHAVTAMGHNTVQTFRFETPEEAESARSALTRRAGGAASRPLGGSGGGGVPREGQYVYADSEIFGHHGAYVQEVRLMDGRPMAFVRMELPDEHPAVRDAVADGHDADQAEFIDVLPVTSLETPRGERFNADAAASDLRAREVRRRQARVRDEIRSGKRPRPSLPELDRGLRNPRGGGGAASPPLSEDALPYAPVNSLAAMIERDWAKVSPHARPYLDAMKSLSSPNDKYGADDGRGIIMYFLSNAGSWRGPTAKAIKAELRRRAR